MKGSAEKEKQTEARDSMSPEEQQQRERDLQERIQKAAACTYILPLGRDRLYRRYWLFSSAPGLFVEEDFSGLTEDMLLPQPPSKPEPEVPSAPESPSQPDDPDPDPPVLQSSGPPVHRPNLWAFYSSPQEVERLMEALNPRGHRESSLKEALLLEKERIAQLLGSCAPHRFHHPGTAGLGPDLNKPQH